MLLIKFVVFVSNRLQCVRNLSLCSICLSDIRVKINSCYIFYIILCIDIHFMNNSLRGINQVEVNLFCETGFLIKLLESLLDSFHRIYEIENVSILFAGIDSVYTAECLYCFNITQFLVDNHCMQKRLVKACLILFGNNQNISFVMEYSGGLTFFYSIAVAVYIHARFSIFDAIRVIWILKTATECNHDFNIIIVVCFKIMLDFMIIANCCKSGCGNNHHFSLTLDFLFCHITEGFNNNCCLLSEVVWMQLLVSSDSAYSFRGWNFRVVRNTLS